MISRQILAYIFILFLCVQLALFQPLSVSSCQNPVNNDLLQSGTYTLTNLYPQNTRTNSFQITVNYVIPSSGLQIAISSARIFGYYSTAIDYSIRAARINTTNIVRAILFIDADLSWTSVKVSYLISSRTDFYLGQFSPQTFGMVGASDNSMMANLTLAHWTPTTSSLNFIYDISGIKINSTYTLALSQASFNSITGVISLRIQCNSSQPLQNIYITYIVYSNTMFNVNQYNPLITTTNGDYNFEALAQVNANAVLYQGYAFTSINKNLNLSCVGNACNTQCITTQLCTSNGGVVVSAANTCYLCGTSQTYSNNQCVPRCSPDQVYSNGNCVCKPGYISIRGQCGPNPCTTNQAYNPGTGQCVCVSGFSLYQNQCLANCPNFVNAVVSQSSCFCIDGYSLSNNQCQLTVNCNLPNQVSVNNVCQCASGFVFNPSKVCVPITCGQNEQLSNNVCQCLSGYTRNSQGVCTYCQAYSYMASNGVCICNPGYQLTSQQTCSLVCGFNQVSTNNINCVCANGFSYNSLGVCVQVCGINEASTNNNCNCISGYTRNTQGICSLATSSCTVNETLIFNQCVCKVGYTRTSSGCVLTSTTCGQNQQYNIFLRSCLCISGYSKNASGVCVLPATCGVNQTLVNNVCQCKNGYSLSTLSNCVLSTCGLNQIYDQSQKSCICKLGYGLTPSSNQCAPCPANSYSSGLLSGCLCNAGYTWNSATFQCQQIVCPSNSYLAASGSCICSTGYSFVDFKCVIVPTCPARSVWNAIKLVCVCTTTGENLLNGQCVSCQSGAVWNGTACNCATGFVSQNSQCVKCSNVAVYSRGQCECPFAFFGDGITCTACSASCGSCQNTATCLTCVNASYTFNNGICTPNVCNPGSFYNAVIKGCSSCPNFCSVCSSTSSCTTCSTGFNLTSLAPTLTTCTQTCGDGTKFYLACDDGNTVNGDGCSSTCNIQEGWTCVGGNQYNKSQCSNGLPTASVLVKGGNVVLSGQVLQGMALTYIPSSLTNGGCLQCNQLLNVSILSSPVIPSVAVFFVTGSQYNFAINFNFGVTGLFIFQFTVRISNSFSNYFTPADLQQVQIITINMGVLSSYQTVGGLSLVNTNKRPILGNPNATQAQTLQINAIPQQALNILFPN